MKRKTPERRKMRWLFSAGVAIILLTTEAINVVLQFVLAKTGFVTTEKVLDNGVYILILWGLASLIFGMLLTMLVSRLIMNPVNKLIDGLEKLSEGKFETRIDVKESHTMAPIFESFNELAAELEKTQILRSDFVNNFSHEFKTPINSINGLISLMKKGKLSAAKQKEYLDIIATEARRLTDMTTNILNMSKYESQGILTDRRKYNLSEQIRTCVLMLEEKWNAKQLALSMDFDEQEVLANEEMLHHVWSNLLDNAVKFASYGGEISVSVRADKSGVFTEISNDGPPIPEGEEENIFGKFYRSDKTHSKEGNGIGLYLVKSIVSLHGGTVSAKSENGKTTFTVFLPQ